MRIYPNRNSLLARPPMESRPHTGVHQYPGFHTTNDFGIAVCYAQSKIHQYNNIKEINGKYRVDDYPVVVGLNGMDRYEKLEDYDAMNFVADIIESFFDEILREIDPSIDDEEIIEKAQRIVEFSEKESMEIPDDPVAAIGEINGMDFEHSTIRSVEHPDFIKIFREYANVNRKFTKMKFLYKKFLMDIACQFRYEEDIDVSHICKVWYINPLAPEMSDYQARDDAEELQEKYEGFDVIDVEDVLSGNFSEGSVEVMSRGDPDEYHGTTYLRLMSAVPDFDLPEPPFPFIRE